MLLTLSQANRWLFTGVVDGQRFERASFGDVEYYTLELTRSSEPLGSAE